MSLDKEEDQNAEEAAHEPAPSNNMVGASGSIPITASTCAFLHWPMAPLPNSVQCAWDG